MMANNITKIWSSPKNKKDMLHKLSDMQIDALQLNDLKVIFEAENSDIYDVLAYVSFNMDIKLEMREFLQLKILIF